MCVICRKARVRPGHFLTKQHQNALRPVSRSTKASRREARRAPVRDWDGEQLDAEDPGTDTYYAEAS